MKFLEYFDFFFFNSLIHLRGERITGAHPKRAWGRVPPVSTGYMETLLGKIEQ